MSNKKDTSTKGTNVTDRILVLGPNKEWEEKMADAIKEKILATAKVKGD